MEASKQTAKILSLIQVLVSSQWIVLQTSNSRALETCLSHTSRWLPPTLPARASTFREELTLSAHSDVIFLLLRLVLANSRTLRQVTKILRRKEDHRKELDPSISSLYILLWSSISSTILKEGLCTFKLTWDREAPSQLQPRTWWEWTMGRTGPKRMHG